MVNHCIKHFSVSSRIAAEPTPGHVCERPSFVQVTEINNETFLSSVHIVRHGSRECLWNPQVEKELGNLES